MTGKDVAIVISIGDKVATVNGKEVKLDSPAFIENGRTYTPVASFRKSLEQVLSGYKPKESSL